LTVKDVSTSDGAEIVQWVCNGGENQRWQLRAHGGSYEIVAKHSGKCLTVLNASTADGALMIQWGCNQATHQLFGVESVGAGLKLTAVHSGKVVDVAGKSHFDGAGVLQWPWGNQTNQVFATRRRNDRNGAVGLQVLSGTVTGFSVGTTRVMDVAFNTAAGSYPGLLIGDVQGDSKPEIVQQWDHDGTLRLKTYTWDGQGYASGGGWSNGAGYASAVGARPRLIMADVTGDGKADLVQQWNFGGWLLLYAYAWNGTQMGGLGSWSQTYNGYASGVGYQPGLIAANVDGGAKTELVQQWNNGGLLSLYAYQWNGSQFVGMGSWTHTAHGYASGAGGHPGLIAADIDGAADGKT